MRIQIFSSGPFYFFITPSFECLYKERYYSEKKRNVVDKKNSYYTMLFESLVYKKVEHDDDRLKEWDKRKESTIKVSAKAYGCVKYDLYKPKDMSLRIYMLVEKGRKTKPMYFVYEKERRLT